MEKIPALKNKITIAIMGRSGSGKGTQSARIVARLGTRARYLGTGFFLRKFMTSHNNASALISKNTMKKGKLFPSWFAAYFWLGEILDGGHANRDLIFDGSPRRIWEAKLMDDFIGWHGRPLPLCLYINVSKKEALRRLLARRRADDTLYSIKSRLAFFPKEVLPTIHYYARRGRLIKINGEKSPEEVWRQIDMALARRLGKLWPKK